MDKKIWINFLLDGVPGREDGGIYGCTDILPPIKPNLKDKLEDIDSPTCYTTSGESIVFEGTTMTPFYHDQQGCVIWYEGTDEKIYYGGRSQMFWCADSKEEFVTRMRIEADLWSKLMIIIGSKIFDNILKNPGMEIKDEEVIRLRVDSDWINEHTDDFTQEERDYLQYYVDNYVSETT